MKALKIKFGLFSLLAILAASVFLTSCEQTEILDATTVENQLNAELPTQLLEMSGFLPTEMKNASKIDVQKHFETAVLSEMNEFQKDFLIASFLADENLLTEELKEQAEAIGFSNVDLSNVLSSKEQSDLDKTIAANNQEVTSRCCATYSYNVYGWCSVGSIYFPCYLYTISWTECVPPY